MEETAKFSGYGFSAKFLAMNQIQVTSVDTVPSLFLPENAGVPEGQEGRGLLLESPGPDADMLVRINSLTCFVWFVTCAFDITLVFYTASWI